ncbi:recombinase family protein [Ramlibacter pallidus]|uniref:Recombinase family protein n=1 Tax=Ramlibacter pallidus TaxID=2780087 RepID=A0ABR9S2Z1_9BURK|nr:recombinase family protein [Ramlibacter pallidus]MBE7367672.1 recombinase family protein [Ramlibacter pallidus]
MEKLAYSYIRFSSAEQAQGDSERRQLAKFQAYCKAAQLTPAEDSFADKGRSGFKAEHLNDTGELRRFLDLARDGEIPKHSTLVVENLDRLGRQEVEDAFGVFTGILGAGIRIVTLPDGQAPQEFVKGKLDLVKLVMVLMDMSRAHEESRRKQELVSAAFANKQALARASYKPMGNTAPLWLRRKTGWRNYEQDGSAYEEIPERAEVVRRIFQRAIEGYGKGVIAKRLNAEGVKSFKAENQKLKARGFDGQWGPSSVDKVLKSRAVFGEYQPTTRRGGNGGKPTNAGDPIPGYFPTVVDVDTFYAAQAAVDGRRTSKATKQSKSFNVFQGIAKCEKCSANLHMVNKGTPPKGGTYLRCAKIGKGGCKCKSVRIEQAEAVFRGMLVRLDALSLVQDSSASIEREIQIIDGQLAEAKRRQAMFRKALDKDSESETFQDAVIRVDSDIRALNKKRQALKTDLAAESGLGWDEFLERLDLVSYEGRAKANALVKRLGVIVTIGPSGYSISQDGEELFGMDYREGEAGYFMPSFGRKLPQFFPVSSVPGLAIAEEAYDALEDEGHPVGEY